MYHGWQFVARVCGEAAARESQERASLRDCCRGKCVRRRLDRGADAPRCQAGFFRCRLEMAASRTATIGRAAHKCRSVVSFALCSVRRHFSRVLTTTLNGCSFCLMGDAGHTLLQLVSTRHRYDTRSSAENRGNTLGTALKTAKIPVGTLRQTNGPEMTKAATRCQFAGCGQWTGPGLNRRHQDFQSCALPTELPVR